MTIQLSDHFTYRKLIRFTLPSIGMMIFTSIYSLVDGFFVSNFVGKTPFAAVNFIMPVLMILGAPGFMYGTGGSALIAKYMGEGKYEKANRTFSLLTYLSAATGVLLAVLGIAFIRPIAALLGAEGEMLEYCVIYGRIIMAGLPAQNLQMAFQSFFITAEKPQLGLFVTVGAGVTNMILDALLVGLLPMCIVGAALATVMSMVVGGFVPVIYFFGTAKSILKLGKTSWDGKSVLKTCTNGSSELMNNLSASIVGILYNMQLMRYAGENGVAAYGVLMYVSFIFVAIFIGFAIGSAPIISFHFGAQNRAELKNLVRKSLLLVLSCSAVMVILCELLAAPMSELYAGYDAQLYAMTCRGFRIYSFAFLFAGLAIFGSSFFTALNNGLVSAVISFLRTLVFQAAAVLLLPLIWEIDGVWYSLVVAELAAASVTLVFLTAMRHRYGYWGK